MFLKICDLFGPEISTLIRNRYCTQETELYRVADEVITAWEDMEGEPDPHDRNEVFLKIELTLQSILCERYRCVDLLRTEHPISTHPSQLTEFCIFHLYTSLEVV